MTPLARRTKGETRLAKSLGQHFLIDGRIVGRIVSAADLTVFDHVVEVGPGRGRLTSALSERVERLVAVEIDRNLAKKLESRFHDRPNVRIVAADARDIDVSLIIQDGVPYKVVANLPYYAAMPIVRRFLTTDIKPLLMVVMVQKEVALQMVAQPGSMGLISVATQLYGRCSLVTEVSSRAFRPQPKVKSAVVRIDLFDAPSVSFDSEEKFFRVVKAGFSAPRKQLRNSLRNGLDVEANVVDTGLLEAGIDPVRRAQTLTMEEWGRLYEIFCGVGAHAHTV